MNKRISENCSKPCGLFSPKEYTLSLFHQLWLGPNIGIRARLQWQPTKRGFKPWRLDSVVFKMECNDLRTLSTGCLKFCFQLGKAPTITTMGEKDLSGHIEKRTTVADKFFSSKMAKLEFPKYSGADPTEWFNRVAQFFEFQDTADNQKVSSIFSS